ncbi:MAG TPA: CoA-binding protein [Nitrolancea sp.]|nr:CoA-binding protein [Nitrolancea sp.]
MSEQQTAPAAFDIRKYQDARTMRDTLANYRNIAIVGLSSNPLRGSYFVAYYLKRHGYHIIPVNPNETEVLGEKAYPTLSDVPGPIDVVDVFRAPEHAPAVAREAVKVGAKVLWLQFGVISPEAAEIAERGGLQVVMDRCMKVEHARTLGRMHWMGFNTEGISAQRGEV